MHILLTNDDGPPSNTASPYILPFYHSLRRAGHTVSVILPSTQRSWIGKAHIVGQDVQATDYYPPDLTPATHDAEAYLHPTSTIADPWILVNSTPATCAQLGVSGHFPTFSAKGPIDIVISGPNFGRNTSAVFILSSGTLGAALEAAVCGYRAVGVSFAFFDQRKNETPAIVDEACDLAVKICEKLGGGGDAYWGNAETGSTAAGLRGLPDAAIPNPDARVYSVNVPVQEGVGAWPVVWTRVLQNVWRKGACFEEVASADDKGPKEAEREVREGKARTESDTGSSDASGVRHFKWAPRFTDVYEAVERAGPGSDGWAVRNQSTSVTALRANFMHVEGAAGVI